MDGYQQSPPFKQQKVIYCEDGGSNRLAKVLNCTESLEIYSYSDTDEDSSLVGCNAMSDTSRYGLTPHKTNFIYTPSHPRTRILKN
jgi:hypothetical protein